MRLRPARPRAVSLPKVSTFSPGNVDGISGVQIGPGATALTRIFFWASAWERGPGETDDRSFGGRIIEELRIPLIRRDRSSVDGDTAFAQISHRRFGEIEHGENVSAKSFLQLLRRDLFDRTLHPVLLLDAASPQHAFSSPAMWETKISATKQSNKPPRSLEAWTFWLTTRRNSIHRNRRDVR